jgi:predicted O-linked N-acetylglucosamine transferase (SPINDLY family)
MPQSIPKEDFTGTFIRLSDLAKNGCREESLALARELKLLPDLSQKHSEIIGVSLESAGEHEEGADFLTQAVFRHPDSAILHHTLGLCLNAQNRAEEALKHFRRAIELCPDSEASLSQAGSALRKLGRQDEALEYLGAAIWFKPDSAVSLYNLGNALFSSGNPEGALTAFQKAASIKPDWHDLLNNLSITLMEMEQYGSAVSILLKLIQTAPGHPHYRAHAAQCVAQIEMRKKQGLPPNAELKKAARDRNEVTPPKETTSKDYSALTIRELLSFASKTEVPEAAILALVDRIKLEASNENSPLELVQKLFLENPLVWQIQLICAEVLWNLGHHDAAALYCEKTEALCPKSGADLFRIALCYQRLNRTEDTIRVLKQACARNDNCSEALELLGNLQLARDHIADAETNIRKAIALRPSRWQLYMQLGCILYRRGLFMEAVRVTEPVARMSDNPILQFNLSSFYVKCERFTDALQAIERCLKAETTSAGAYMSLGTILSRLGLGERCTEAFGRARRLDPSSHVIASCHLQSMNYLPNVSPEEIFAKQREFAETFESPLLAAHAPHSNARDAKKRLRIGYVSGDLREHSVAYFISPIFIHHDPDQFEVWGIATEPWQDHVTERMRQHCQGWISASNMSDAQLAQTIRDHGFDILVDLSCYTEGTRLLTFARKPAPVQVTMIGMQQSTGLSSIDYRISDHIMDPPGLTERVHSEELLRLECAFCFEPPAGAPEVCPLPASTGSGITFGSFNNAAKVHPAVVQTWAEILRRVPGSKLIAVAPEGNALESMLLQAGANPADFSIVPLQFGSRYWQLLNRVDIALDSFPCTGLTVSAIAAWMGIPTVTVAGDSPISRAGTALAHAIGLESWVAEDQEGYISIAAAAARDLDALASLRASMRQRMQLKLTDGKLFTRSYERALREAWSRWCATP